MNTYFAAAIALVLIACKGDKPESRPPPPPTSPSGSAMGSGSDPVATGSGDPVGPVKPIEPTGIPECDAWKTAIEKLMACDQVEKSARDATRAAFEQAAKRWATPDGKAT